MDVDAATLWLSTRSMKSYEETLRLGVHLKMFKGPTRKAWKFIAEYVEKHSELPGASLVVDNSGAAIFEPESEEDERVSLTYVIDELFDRYRFWCLQHGLSEIGKHFDDDKYTECEAELEKLLGSLKDLSRTEVQAEPISVPAKKAIENYHDKEVGIEYPWPSMTEMTSGLRPETLTFFVARPAVGKSWTAILLAMHAAKNGHRVLFVSPEMPSVDVGERALAIQGHISFGDIVARQLGDGVGGQGGHHRLNEALAEFEAMENEPYILVGDRTFQGTERAIRDLEPDLLIIDSVYHLTDKRKKTGRKDSRGARYDQATDMSSWLMELPKKYSIPVVAISQLNRDVRMTQAQEKAIRDGHGDGGLESSIALTDNFLWDADNIFALWRDDEMKQMNEMLYVPLKVRRSASKRNISTSWDLAKMAFSEQELSPSKKKPPPDHRNPKGGNRRFKPKEDDEYNLPY